MLARLSLHRYSQLFAITADPRVVFESTAFRSAFLALTNAIAVRTGLILLIGDPGCGKTLLLRALHAVHGRSGRPAFLRHAAATGDLLAALLAELRPGAVPTDREGRRRALAEALAQRPGPALLLVDAGEELSHHQLAELASLADWRRGESEGLQIIVAGRPETKDRIERGIRTGPVRHAVATTRLGPLLRQEIGHYVAHHLTVGRSHVSFGPSALDRLYTHSEGLPLKINLLSTCALGRRTRRIEAADIDAAAQFCGLIPAPADHAVGSAGPAARRAPPRHTSAARRAGGRILRAGYRAVSLAALSGVAFAVIHLLQSVGDVARNDGDVRIAIAPQRPDTDRVEPAPRDYIAAAVKTLAEPGTLLAPAILAGPLPARGTELAQAAIERAPAPAIAAPEAPPDRADAASLEQAVKAVNQAEEMAAAAALDDESVPAPETPALAPSAGTDASPDEPPQPVITHLWPGGDSEASSGAAEPRALEAVAQFPREAAASVARAPSEEPAPSPAAAVAHDSLSGAAAASPPPRADALDMDWLMRRGHALLQDGDVASARLFFERAAAAGHAAALTALGLSFDPLELQRLGVIGIKADPGRALDWYRAADAAGDAVAQERGARLSSWVERGQAAR